MVNKTETITHEKLRLVGRRLLLGMGIKSKNILEELTLESNGHKHRVDLAGFKSHWDHESSPPRPFVIIEVGGAPAERIRDLRETYPCVIHLPYSDYDDFTSSISKQERIMFEEIRDGLRQHTSFIDVSKQALEKLIMKYLGNLEELKAESNRITDVTNTIKNIQFVLSNSGKAFENLAKVCKKIAAQTSGAGGAE